MKIVNKFLVIILGLISVSVCYSQTVNQPYEVGTWQGFRTAAISYTFDDNCSNQLALAVPMFNEFDFNLTLFTVLITMVDIHRCLQIHLGKVWNI